MDSTIAMLLASTFRNGLCGWAMLPATGYRFFTVPHNTGPDQHLDTDTIRSLTTFTRGALPQEEFVVGHGCPAINPCLPQVHYFRYLRYVGGSMVPPVAVAFYRQTAA